MIKIEGLGEFNLRFNFTALTNFSQQTGIELQSLGEEMKLSHIAVLIFEAIKAGAKRDGKKIEFTLEDLKDNIDLPDIPKLMEAFQKDLSGFMEPVKEGSPNAEGVRSPLPSTI